MSAKTEADAPVLARLWTYQAERFPLIQTVPLLAAFSAASVTASARLADRSLPHLSAYLIAFLIVMVFFFQMRALDEVKDAETDRRYRPERPIPRGLVSLGLILWIAGVAVLPAALGAYWVSPLLLLLVILAWGWLALMSFEFFAPKFLHASPALYLVSHMAIMPLIDLVLTGAEWAPYGTMPPGLWTFLLMSFANGCVVEFGRKIWAPEQEREGVETYSSSWGIKSSLLALGVAVLTSFAALVICGIYLARPVETALCGLAVLLPTIYVIIAFSRHPDQKRQKRLETLSGVWVLACYLAAAFTPTLGVSV
ncbi:UbiA family prenyltransferase [Labrenzia sp. VG12]|uniref:UbiA family prenyltransferase n=1 Tax=Labrenzia sp. VG12 TaxID=2021862 RepID=UPI000B8C3203|nr:UbiA family prenyltransferase [Labrenzia sp. VG12]ASP33067.1 manganese transporter permease [Labrenzia sp. VG12]